MIRNTTNEFMKIRQYVLDLITTGDGTPQKIPSSRKLGEMFGVTHPTALRAIQVLTEDGYLVPLAGGGSLTVPPSSGLYTNRIFGILTEDGKVAFENYYHHRLHSAIGLNLTRRSIDFTTQNIYLNTAEELEKVIRHNHIRGLFLLGIRKESLLREIEKLRKQNFPLASMIVSVPEVSSYYTRNSDCCVEMLKKLFSEERQKIIIMLEPGTQSIEGIEEKITQTCEEYGVPRGNILVVYEPEAIALERIRQLYSFGMRFNGMIHFRNINSFYPELRKLVDVEDECRMIDLEYSITGDLHYTGYVLKFDLEDAAEKLISNMLEQCDGSKPSVLSEKIKVTFEFYKNGTVTGKDTES